MSAIAGVLQRAQQPLSSADTESMMAALAQYGADGAAAWQSEGTWLGQQMTYDTPESQRERLPLEITDAGLTIVADVRLDNRAELSQQLQLPGEATDAAIVLHAYRRWGTQCASRLLGDFAFAIWDSRNKRLYCARDIVGVKPFYYRVDSRAFLFASDIRAVLAHSAVAPALFLPLVRASFDKKYGNPSSEQHTYFRDIKKLPPAHQLVVTADGFVVERYWNPWELPTIRYANDQDYVDHLQELVREAVKCRLRSAYPVGTHISGGLDSSTVSVLAARQYAGRLAGFSWAAPVGEDGYMAGLDERRRIDAIAREEGIDVQYTPLTGLDLSVNFAEDLTRVPQHTMNNERVVARQAQERGVRVMLSGWGGDEIATFNGRGYFADLFLRGKWRLLQRELKLRHSEEILGGRWQGSVLYQVVNPLLPMWFINLLPARLRSRYRLPLPPSELPRSVLQPDFLRALDATQSLPGVNLREVPGVKANQVALLQEGHLSHRMEAWAANGAKHNLEYRFPLLDRRVIEFCLGVPDYLFFKDGWKRWMFRQMVGGILPREIQWDPRKSDAAMGGHPPAIYRQGEMIQTRMLERRRDAMRSAGLVNPDAVLDFIASGEPRAEAPLIKKALWLAYVDPPVQYPARN
jgi:asparagine synthase (glutamine-hydrolysing)